MAQGEKRAERSKPLYYVPPSSKVRVALQCDLKVYAQDI